MSINPIMLYHSYNNTKPVQKNNPVNIAYGNNRTEISPQLQADILDVKNAGRKLITPLENLKTDVNHFDKKIRNNPIKTPAFTSLTLKNNDDFGKIKLALGALSPIPTFRRVMSVPDSIEEENMGRTAGTLGLAVLNMPADIRDSLKLGMAEISSIKNGTGTIKVQVNQNFLGGTLLSAWRDKSKWLNSILKHLDKYDKTISETNFGKLIQDKFKIKSKPAFFSSGKTSLQGYVFENNIFRRTAGCSLKRIPIIGLALSTLFEIPALYKAATIEGDMSTKTKSFTKQLCKSGSFLGLNTIAIAVGGGIAMATGIGILAAIGLSAGGAALALYGSNKINKQIDKLFA